MIVLYVWLGVAGFLFAWFCFNGVRAMFVDWRWRWETDEGRVAAIIGFLIVAVVVAILWPVVAAWWAGVGVRWLFRG